MCQQTGLLASTECVPKRDTSLRSQREPQKATFRSHMTSIYIQGVPGREHPTIATRPHLSFISMQMYMAVIETSPPIFNHDPDARFSASILASRHCLPLYSTSNIISSANNIKPAHSVYRPPSPIESWTTRQLETKHLCNTETHL